MRSAPVVPMLALAAVGLAALAAYATIKPALFIAILTAMALTGFYWCLSDAWRRDLGRAPIVVGLAMPLLAWATPGIWLLYAAMALIVPLGARRRGEVAALYLFALMLLPDLGLEIKVGDLKLFEFGVANAIAIGAVIRLLALPRAPRIPIALDLPFAALVLLLVSATARDTSATNFLRVLINAVLDCVLPYYVVSRSVRGADDVRRCMVHLAAAAAVLSTILLYEVQSGWPMYNMLYDHYAIPMQLIVKTRGGVLRAGGPFLESTSIAMVLASCILAAWLARAAFRSSLAQAAVLALLLAGLTAPQSRGAWVGLLLGTIVADLYRRRIAALATRLLAIGAVVGGLLAAAPFSPYLSDTLGLSEGSASTVDYRQRLFERGMEEYWKSPLIGYSPPQILIHLADLRQGEGIVDFVNTYIYFALISGIVGLVVFVGAFALYLHRLWQRRRTLARGDPATDAPAFVFAGLVMPMEMLIFTSFGGRPETLVYVQFALAAALIAAASRAPRPARRRAPWWEPQTSGTPIADTP